MAEYLQPDEIAADAYSLTPAYEFNSTMPGGSGGGASAEFPVTGNSVVDALIRYYSASQAGKASGQAGDQLQNALSQSGLLREGLKKDSSDFYDQTAKTLSGDVAAFLPTLADATKGSARGEQYGQDATDYVTKLLSGGLGRIDSGVATGKADLGAARDKAVGDVRGVFDPAMKGATDEVGYQRNLGKTLIDYLTKGADSARSTIEPMLQSTAARYQAPNQYTAAGLRGMLTQLALRGVDDSYRNTTEAAVRQAVRSGTGAGPMLEDLARQRARESETAMLQAGKDSLGMSTQLNQGKRDSEAKNFTGLSEALRSREALVPQGYDIASRGSLGAQGLAAQLAAAYGSALNQPNTAYINGVGDINKAVSPRAPISLARAWLLVCKGRASRRSLHSQATRTAPRSLVR